MLETMTVYTMGFAKKTAAQFFTTLQKAHIVRLIDVRLNNVSQLAGFTKKTDLQYFIPIICKAEYVHRPDWAPTKVLLDDYKTGKTSWAEYEIEFAKILDARRITSQVDISYLNHACLLCTEPTPEQCHRRLLAEAFRKKMPELKIIHL